MTRSIIEHYSGSGDLVTLLAARLARTQEPALGFAIFLGDDFARMATDLLQILTARSVRTVRFDCIAR